LISLIIVICALIIDRLWGEPRRFHPLVGFGLLARRLETFCQYYMPLAIFRQRILGVLAVLLLVIPLSSLAWLISTLGFFVDILILYLAIAWQSLRQHALRVRCALQRDDLLDARIQIDKIVSRDTQQMDQQSIIRATIESVLENGNDAIFAAVFWYLLAGVPGLVAYRLVNTLDAMWGYKTPRYLYFGWAAARLDDVMNYLPARLTAFSYALAGRFANAMRCWRTQASLHASPNAGPVMAAGAGSLGILLGGTSSYHGNVVNKPVLGAGVLAQIQHINASLALLNRVIIIWLLVMAVGVYVGG